VPESVSGSNDSGHDSPMSNERQLFLIGFIMLALCAAGGSLLINGEVAKVAARFNMHWAVEAVAFFPWLGFLFEMTGAMIGVGKSKAPVQKRLLWFAITQLAAALLWWASTLH